MSGRAGSAYRGLRRRLRQQAGAFRRWVEHTRNLVHLSVLFAIPLLMGVVTYLSNSLAVLPYLLFPPLASGSYSLFTNPESPASAPRRFIGGLTAGALCGWVALAVTARYWYQVPPGQYQVHAGAVALGLFLTGAVTWVLDLREASAYSTALLVHVTGTAQIEYVLSVFLSATIVAGVFVAWRRGVYENRADLLYDSIRGDDRVLVPLLAEEADATAMLAARLAGAHDAGKVVLLDIVDDEAVASVERELIDTDATYSGDAEWLANSTDQPLTQADRDDLEAADFDTETLDDIAEKHAVSAAADRLETDAARIETKVGVPCDVIVAADGDSPADTISRTAKQANCDLIAVPYQERHGGLSPTVKQLFVGDIDVLVHRSQSGRTRWRRILVPARTKGVAHSMIDFATRLAGRTGHVSVCHCIDAEGKRREAEELLADLVETFTGRIETRVAAEGLQSFLAENAPGYDLIIIGSSQDRSPTSRFISPPTFERLEDIETDIAIVDRNYVDDRL
ncbi:conserved hypothetical protein [Halorhabdus utahensis DSM 12940]|uniref:HPP transmembrane region domain-containing protein n=1 Tax=Halorhabdus utahensis (strain DSM 12940 / JCM 11049 / AX-2) TaxID=519442 RepID=C7NRY4_HALUD|nr:HPP family protein [Halorhabdus utahensis]ACV13159.1 conserved hypothetical protein [Halorhabdus utahensis DSM 12940]